MADVPARLTHLVETFAHNIEAYKANGYNEAQLRREFIDPLFELLGWDVTNKQAWAPAYREVIHEDAIKVGGSSNTLVLPILPNLHLGEFTHCAIHNYFPLLSHITAAHSSS